MEGDAPGFSVNDDDELDPRRLRSRARLQVAVGGFLRDESLDCLLKVRVADLVTVVAH
ncbi:hypothetical protein MAHJHV55_20560 [Mycobacterium avium subsp. hominissuis]|mgnify:FL=1